MKQQALDCTEKFGEAWICGLGLGVHAIRRR